MEDRTAKMRERARRSYKGREKKGSGGSSVLVGLPGEVNQYEVRSGQEKNIIDIIPFVITADWYSKLKGFTGAPTGLEPGDLDYKFEIPVHGRLGMNGKERRLCLYEAFGKPCAVCQDKYAELEKGRNNWDINKIRDLNPSWRCFYNVYDYQEPDEALAYKWWEVAYNSFEKILLEQAGDDPHFFELVGGQTLEFYGREKAIGDGSWIEPQIPDFFDRDPYDETVLELALSFDQYLYIPDPAEVTELHLGIESGDTEEEPPPAPQQDAAASRTRRRSTTRAYVPPPEDDIPFDETTEAPAAARSRSQTRSTAAAELANECPSGYVFGIDCLNKPECQDCPDKYFDRCAALQKEGEEKKEPPPTRGTRSRGGATTTQNKAEARQRPKRTEQPAPAASSASPPTRTRRRRA